MARTLRLLITGSGDLTRAADALRAESAALPTELRRALKKAVKPAVAQAKANIAAYPTRSRYHSGLRRRVAAGVKAEAATGRNPRVRIVTSMKNPEEASLPYYMDQRGGWRHPVFGDTRTWVPQEGHPWFTPAMRDAGPIAHREIHEVLEDVADRIHRAGT